MLIPILLKPDQEVQFQLETDTSGYATRAVLSQLYDNNKWHTIRFISKSLTKAERNYNIHDKELLSVIQDQDEWRHIPEGTKHKIEIFNDHKNLMYF